MNSLLTSIDHYSTRHNLLPHNARVIIGLSGGPDSIFLLHALKHYQDAKQLSLIVAHLDHQWRPQSGDDARFCKHVADKLGLIYVSTTMQELGFTAKYNGSREAYARHARRYFLEQTRLRYHADLIALGHHADDQQETFFLRLVRGTTLSGIVGMKPRDGVYIRPLLATPKDAILAYLATEGITYCIDNTNTNEAFLRNSIRKHLAAFKTCDERFSINFARTLNHLHDAESFLHTLTRQAYNTITHQATTGIALDLHAWANLDPFLQPRVIMQWLIEHNVPFTPSEGFLQEIDTFLKHPGNGRHHLNRTWHLVKKQRHAFIHHV